MDDGGLRNGIAVFKLAAATQKVGRWRYDFYV